jgi:hypothetical protein
MAPPILLLLGVATLASAKLPNFLTIIIDDLGMVNARKWLPWCLQMLFLGYGDLSCFGRENISTPHVDSLAKDGLKLTQWLSAASVCSTHPPRAAYATTDVPFLLG